MCCTIELVTRALEATRERATTTTAYYHTIREKRSRWQLFRLFLKCNSTNKDTNNTNSVKQKDHNYNTHHAQYRISLLPERTYCIPPSDIS